MPRSRHCIRPYSKISQQDFAVSSTHGLAHYQIFSGGMTNERFPRFLEVLCGNEIMENTEASGICVYDKARPHVRITDQDVPGNFTVKRLPRYSPFLNMAENAISCWKQAIKNSLAIRRQEFIVPTDQQLQGRTLQAYRFDTIKDIINSTAGVITPSKCASWYNHTTTYLPACIGRESIHG